MAVRSAATVAALAKKRGAGNLSVGDFMWLQENKKEIKNVTVLLKLDAETARDAEKKAIEAKNAAEAKLAEVVKADLALTKREAGVAEAEKKAAAKFDADVEVLRRRAETVKSGEASLVEREAALEKRYEQFTKREQSLETEFQAREEVIIDRENAADERDMKLQKLASDLNFRRTRLDTAVKMFKKAYSALD